MRKTIATITACLIAVMGAVIDAGPADAATRGTMVSGTYFTDAEWRSLLDMPSWVPIAKPGRYRTTGRPAKRSCSVRAFDITGNKVAGIFLVKARSYTIEIPENALWVDVSGPCTWKRA